MSEITITHKNTFARDSLGWLRLVIFLQLIFLGSLIVFIVMQYQADPEPVYFPFKRDDQLIETMPLEQPGLTDAELLNWVTEAMIVSFSFNYHNYNKISEKIEEYFDSIGVASYLKMITEHKNMQQVVNKKMILSGRPTGAPRIVKDGVVDGRYAWEIALPFILKFRSQEIKLDLELTLDILVVRMPEQYAPLGVKIVQIQDLANVGKVKPKIVQAPEHNLIPIPMATSNSIVPNNQDNNVSTSPVTPNQDNNVSTSPVTPNQDNNVSTSSVTPNQDNNISTSPVTPNQDNNISTSPATPNQDNNVSTSPEPNQDNHSTSH